MGASFVWHGIIRVFFFTIFTVFTAFFYRMLGPCSHHCNYLNFSSFLFETNAKISSYFRGKYVIWHTFPNSRKNSKKLKSGRKEVFLRTFANLFSLYCKISVNAGKKILNLKTCILASVVEFASIRKKTAHAACG